MSDFRLLDLGAHDGFVTQFVARQAQKAGRTIHVDGVEANKEGVRLFNERAKRDGIPGECKHGLVEDAGLLFEKHSYDAVVAYELIEHVKDVDGFLDSVEWMVKRGGRVYISTPNGTFGSGRNPHHLRTWTINTLFDLLRRRGQVCDILPGPDGVSVVSYKPDPPRRSYREVGIYVGPGWEEWAPSDIETKGLGGSETAAVRLAQALTTYDCRVTVYGQTPSGAVDQVLYKPHEAFDPMDRRDLLIVSRIPEVFARHINAEKSVLWLHDVDCGDRLTAGHMQFIDKIMCLSEWHRRHLVEVYPWLTDDDLYITRNGIEPSYFLEGEVERNPHRAIYTSSPDRGLDFLLELWPSVRERVPDAELAFAYASVYHAVAEQNPSIREFRDYIHSLSGQPGVVNLGSLTQPGVAKEMRASGIWLAPSFSSPGVQRFHETFCIGAVEAAAAGCRRIMSAWGALEERDESVDSVWIDSPYVKPVDHLWADAIVEAMTDRSRPWQPSSTALEMDWEEVAADMLAASFG